jgi:ribose transport system substrate-binding protein
MKKIFSLISVLTAASILSSCFGGNGGAAATTPPPAATTATAGAQTQSGAKKIYLITMDQMDQHWANVDSGAKKAVQELGNIDYRWSAPDVKDDAKQIEQINNAVADGADAILLAANGPAAVTSALEEAKSAGVKIVYVDSPADFPAAKTFATDNTAAGATAGKEALDALTAKGVTSGKIGVISVNAATASTVARETGFKSAFSGTNFEILETQYCDGDAARAQQFAENFITQGVVALFGANEGSTVGVGNAIKEDGNKIVGVGFDKSDMILSLIDGGSLLGAMAQNPDVMGYEGMKAAAGVLDGTVAEDGAVVDTGVSVLKSGKTQAAASGKYKIYLITMDQMDKHWVTLDSGAKKAAEELGNIDYRWSAPDVKDDAKQIEQINNAVADGADAIILAANGPTAVTSALEEAAEAGVMIVYVDSPADFPAVKTFSTDNTAAGATAGKQALDALTAKGLTSGSIGVISVNAATASTVARETGFRSAFSGTGFEILETQYCDGDAARAQQYAENFITQGVVALFGANEGSTVGVGNAINDDGNKIIGVGFDKSITITALIDEGALLCTMAQNPDVMGYEGMKAAAGALAGTVKADGGVTDTGVSVLTK